MHCSTSSQGVVWSLSPEVFQNHGDVALRNVGSGHGGEADGWTEVFSDLNDFVTLSRVLIVCMRVMQTRVLVRGVKYTLKELYDKKQLFSNLSQVRIF